MLAIHLVRDVTVKDLWKIFTDSAIYTRENVCIAAKEIIIFGIIFGLLWHLSQLAFERAWRFMVWSNRELYLGYYFAVIAETKNSTD